MPDIGAARSWHRPQIDQALEARQRLALKPHLLVRAADHPVIAPGAFVAVGGSGKKTVGQRAADSRGDLGGNLARRAVAGASRQIGQLALHIDDALLVAAGRSAIVKTS